MRCHQYLFAKRNVFLRTSTWDKEKIGRRIFKVAKKKTVYNESYEQL